MTRFETLLALVTGLLAGYITGQQVANKVWTEHWEQARRKQTMGRFR
ncbi:hypothetical protein [Halococcus sp. AFM35]